MQLDPLNSDEPITLWIKQLEQGELAAAQPLWNHFCHRLMELAERRLSPQIRRTYDQEDVAVSAFHSLCRAVSQRHADLNSRVNLWRLLITITERKISSRVRDEYREKRDVRRTVSENCLIELPIKGGLDQLAGREPSPEFAVEFGDLCESLLKSLPNDILRQVAELALMGYDTELIAIKLGVSPRTVERKLLIIRARWEKTAC